MAGHGVGLARQDAERLLGSGAVRAAVPSHGVRRAEIDEADDLYDRVREALYDGRHAKDRPRGRAIATELCELVREQLDAEQLAVVTFAKRFQARPDQETEWRRHLGVAWQKDRECYWGEPVSHARQAVSRLVACSVVNNGNGLDYDLGEWLIYLALKAGIGVEQIGEVFTRHVPGFVSRAG